MANGLLIGWKRAVPGKEAFALELFNTAKKYFEKKKKEGVVQSLEPVFLGAHGGDLNGFMLVRSTPDDLSVLRTDEELLRLVTKCSIVLEDFRVVDIYVGDQVDRRMALYQQSI